MTLHEKRVLCLCLDANKWYQTYQKEQNDQSYQNVNSKIKFIVKSCTIVGVVVLCFSSSTAGVDPNNILHFKLVGREVGILISLRFAFCRIS